MRQLELKASQLEDEVVNFDSNRSFFSRSRFSSSSASLIFATVLCACAMFCCTLSSCSLLVRICCCKASNSYSSSERSSACFASSISLSSAAILFFIWAILLATSSICRSVCLRGPASPSSAMRSSDRVGRVRITLLLLGKRQHMDNLCLPKGKQRIGLWSKPAGVDILVKALLIQKNPIFSSPPVNYVITVLSNGTRAVGQVLLVQNC